MSLCLFFLPTILITSGVSLCLPNLDPISLSPILGNFQQWKLTHYVYHGCLQFFATHTHTHTEHWPPFSLCWALQCYLLTQKANEKIPDHYIILWNMTVFLPLSQSSDFSDITNWPTPGELAKEVWYVWMQLLLQAMGACFLVLLLAASKIDLFFQFLLTRWSARSILKCSGCSFAEGWCRFLKRGCLIKCKKVFWFWSHMVRCLIGGGYSEPDKAETGLQLTVKIFKLTSSSSKNYFRFCKVQATAVKI